MHKYKFSSLGECSKILLRAFDVAQFKPDKFYQFTSTEFGFKYVGKNNLICGIQFPQMDSSSN